MGAVCALDGLNEFSRNAASPKIRESVALACEYILMHRLFKADHHGWKTINKDWLLLRAPYLWNYDIVRGLLALRNAGIDDDPRMKDALTVLKSKKTRSGRWIREKNWMGNSYSTFGRRGREDKWITLNALRALNRTGTK